MKHVKLIFLAVAAFMLMAPACRLEVKTEDPNVLPPATQVGANTFGCKINGVVYKTKQKWQYSMIMPIEGVKAGIDNNKNMWIVSEFIYPKRNKVYFSFKYDEKLGKYLDISEVKKKTDSYINITRFDNGIISGTFNIIKYTTDYVGGDSITTYYTDGRFDIKYK